MGTSLVGRNIGNYRITGKLGSGGVGQVWRAVDTTLGRTVAVKALRPELVGRSQIAQRFRTEAQILARLNHPNIATLHSLVEEDGELYMVLEHVEGQTFAQLLRVKGALELERAFDLFHPALDGISYAHDAGVVHRDIKPSNLMVDARGLVKVMDFGIARCDESERVTRTGHLVGTPEYMSPEQIRGGDATVASDVYALGILLYALLTGRPPFQRDGDFDVMRAQVETPPPRPSELAPGLPPAIDDALLRALAKAPGDRFATVASFRDALIAAGAPEHTAGNLPTWAGTPGPTTLADADAPTEAHGLDGPSAHAQDATTLAAGHARRVGRWQHAAVVLLAVSLSLGASALHVEPRRVDAQRPVAGTTPRLAIEPQRDTLAASATEATPLVEASVSGDVEPAPEPTAKPSREPGRPPLARSRPARDDPPAVEETGWVIRR